MFVGGPFLTSSVRGLDCFLDVTLNRSAVQLKLALGKEYSSFPTTMSDDQEQQDINRTDQHSVRSSQIHDATERTALLPHRVVPIEPPSPYNLFSVRLVAFVVKLLVVADLILLIIFTINIFNTLPLLFTRGGGMLPLAYTGLTFFLLVTNVLFFETASKSVRGVDLFMCFLFILQAFLIVIIADLRVREGALGVIMALYAAFVAFWLWLTNVIVERGERKEEERVTGQDYEDVEHKLTFKDRMKITFFFVFCIGATLASVLITANLILRTYDATDLPPGQLYWMQGPGAGQKFRLHLHCVGEHAIAAGKNKTINVPTVLLETGSQEPTDYFSTWATELTDRGDIGRVCYWDRPGEGFSDNAPSALTTISEQADMLYRLLEKSNEIDSTNGFVMVGHSWGPLIQRILASRHNRLAKGFLFLDPLHEKSAEQFNNDYGTWAKFSDGTVAYFKVLIGPLGISRLLGAVLKGRDRVYRRHYNNENNDRAFLLQKWNSFAQGGIPSVISSKADFPRDRPFVLVSSAEMMKNPIWDAGQRAMTDEADDVKWDIVQTGHAVFEGKGRDTVQKRLTQLVRRG